MIEITLFLEIAHGVSDGRRRHPKSEILGDSTRSRRFRGAYVRMNDSLENQLFPIRKSVFRHDSKWFIYSNLPTFGRGGQGHNDGIQPEPPLGGRANPPPSPLDGEPPPIDGRPELRGKIAPLPLPLRYGDTFGGSQAEVPMLETELIFREFLFACLGV